MPMLMMTPAITGLHSHSVRPIQQPLRFEVVRIRVVAAIWGADVVVIVIVGCQ